MNFYNPLLVVCVVVAVVAKVTTAAYIPTASEEQDVIHRLSTFKSSQSQLVRGPDGTYRFSFSHPQQERTEQREKNGKVIGSYAVVDPVGEEVSVNYEADHEGFRAESDALPQVWVAAVAGWCCSTAASQTLYEGPLLSTFKEITQRESRGPLGSYQFSFSLPQQERFEHRDEQGKVTGTYTFVDKIGNEVSVNYDADHSGFRARSDSLPQPPQDTPDVAKAKEEFLRHYQRTAQLLKVFDEEESSESSEEDDDDESESDEDSSSSEEGEDSDEDEEDDDEEEEDEEEEEEDKGQEEEEDEDEESVRGQGYNERGREDEEEEDEETEDEQLSETRLLFERILPAQLNIPLNPTQRTDKVVTFNPSLLRQPRFNSNRQIFSPGQNSFP
ncbi:hypothetical protein O3P69_010094 [Scylla paramamosain]|uniref:Uncharacterized protein n=1 Tax=Scylla paramamosain TaxID=85552 RepID=A0AAW0SP39_SCYPA